MFLQLLNEADNHFKEILSCYLLLTKDNVMATMIQIITEAPFQKGSWNTPNRRTKKLTSLNQDICTCNCIHTLSCTFISKLIVHPSNTC